MTDNAKWAEETFGKTNLGDPRRTSRLVKLAETLANTPGKPFVNITESPADMEGAYRSIRRINRIPDLFNRSDFVGFRVIELTIGTGQWVKKLGLDSVRYGVYPENRQKSARQAC